MEIIIPLPNLNSDVKDYQGLRIYLKQLETAVHYAQKSVENAEKEGVEVSEDCFVEFQHPSIEDDKKGEMYEELQSVSLRISLQ